MCLNSAFEVKSCKLDITHGLFTCTEISEWIIDRTGRRTLLYLICSKIPNVDLARYGISRDKDLGILELYLSVV